MVVVSVGKLLAGNEEIVTIVVVALLLGCVEPILVFVSAYMSFSGIVEPVRVVVSVAELLTEYEGIVTMIVSVVALLVGTVVMMFVSVVISFFLSSDMTIETAVLTGELVMVVISLIELLMGNEKIEYFVVVLIAGIGDLVTVVIPVIALRFGIVEFLILEFSVIKMVVESVEPLIVVVSVVVLRVKTGKV